MIPEVISKDEKGIISLAYSNLIPVLVEAIKELKRNQNEKIEDLLNRLRTVTMENVELKRQLSELRQENREVREKSISFEERLKALEENRYAKK